MIAKSKWVYVVTVATLSIGLFGLLMGCPDNGVGPSPDGVTKKISGVVRDSVSGDPVSGVDVTFADSSTTTGVDGSFSLDLGVTSDVVTGSFSTSASGYEYNYWEEVVADTSKDSDLQVYIKNPGVDTAGPSGADPGYTTQQLNLTVKDSGNNEIPTGWKLSGKVLNSDGGVAYLGIHNYTNGGSNIVDNPTLGSDCLVVANVRDNTDALQFVVWASQVGISSSAMTSLTLTETACTSVDITADEALNMGMLTLWTPYGLVNGGEWEFTSSKLISGATLYNPYGYEGNWAQVKLDISDPDYEKLLLSTSAIEPIGTSVTLPFLDDTLGPDAGYTGFSVSYSPSTGVLSFPAVSGASYYLIEIREPTGTPGAYYRHASIYLASESITLPQRLRDDLSGVTADISVTAADMGNSTFYLSEIFHEFPPDIKAGFALEKGGSSLDDGYLEEDVAF